MRTGDLGSGFPARSPFSAVHRLKDGAVAWCSAKGLCPRIPPCGRNPHAKLASRGRKRAHAMGLGGSVGGV